MNILFLADCYIEPSVGGIQRVTDTLAKEFVKRGHKVYFLSVNWGQMIAEYVPTSPQFYVDVKNTREWPTIIKQILDKNKIEYIINQMPGTLTNKVIEKVKTKEKIVSVFHTQPFLDDNVTRQQILRTRTYNFKQRFFKYISFLFPSLRSLIFGRLEKRLILNTINISDRVCFISERFFPRVLKHIPNFPQEKLIAINNPNTFVSYENIKKKEKVLLWVGRVENGVKNTIGFVKIWEHLYKKNPLWKAIVVGDGDDLGKVSEYAKKHQITNIEFIGRCDDVKSLYERAKIVVVTSFSESWCMVLTEGLAYGCVVCAYDTYETVRDIVVDNINGIVSEPYPEIMAKKLHIIMNNENKFNKLAVNTKNSIAKYSVEIIIDQWIHLLLSL